MTDPACRELAAAVVVKTVRDLEAYETLATKTVKDEVINSVTRYARDAAYCLRYGGLDPYMEMLGYSAKSLLRKCEMMFPRSMELSR